MTISNRIEGTIRLISPLHCATIDKSSDASDNQNVTNTHKFKLMTSTAMQMIPYFPANDMRGRLRREAATLILDYITANAKVTPELYQGLMGGSVTTSLESDLTIEEALRARDNVYMGLFGGGTRVLRSRYATNDLIPVLQDTIDAGCVPASFGEAGVLKGRIGDGVTGPLTGYHMVEARTSFHIDDVANFTSAEDLEKYIDDAVNSVGRLQVQSLSDGAKRKSDKDAAKAGEIHADDVSKKKTLRNMFAVESIARGTSMYFLTDMTNGVSDAHVGLLLLALQSLVRKQNLGGWIRAGFGRYTADLTLTRNDQKYMVFVPGMNAADAKLTDEVHAFCKPALAAISALTAESMMEFFTVRAPVKEKKEKTPVKAAKKDKGDAAGVAA